MTHHPMPSLATRQIPVESSTPRKLFYLTTTTEDLQRAMAAKVQVPGLNRGLKEADMEQSRQLCVTPHPKLHLAHVDLSQL
jgi:hypothetical protein